MNRTRAVVVSMMLLLVTLLGTQSAQASGSYTAYDNSTTKIQFTNQYVNGQTISPLTSVGTITTIQWSYQQFSPPSVGRQSQLCDATTNTCVSLSGNASGVTSFFAGRPVTDSFYFQFGVFTSGSYNKQWQVYQKQIIVSYQ